MMKVEYGRSEYACDQAKCGHTKSAYNSHAVRTGKITDNVECFCGGWIGQCGQKRRFASGHEMQTRAMA